MPKATSKKNENKLKIYLIQQTKKNDIKANNHQVRTISTITKTN